MSFYFNSLGFRRAGLRLARFVSLPSHMDSVVGVVVRLTGGLLRKSCLIRLFACRLLGIVADLCQEYITDFILFHFSIYCESGVLNIRDL